MSNSNLKKRKKGWERESRRHSDAAIRGARDRKRRAMQKSSEKQSEFKRFPSNAANSKTAQNAKRTTKNVAKGTVKEVQSRDIIITKGDTTVEFNKAGSGSKAKKINQMKGRGMG